MFKTIIKSIIMIIVGYFTLQLGIILSFLVRFPIDNLIVNLYSSHGPMPLVSMIYHPFSLLIEPLIIGLTGFIIPGLVAKLLNFNNWKKIGIISTIIIMFIYFILTQIIYPMMK